MDKIRNFLSHQLSDKFDLPPDIIGGIYTITITGNSEIAINECGYILKYEDGELFLQLKDRILKIFGRNIMLKTYYRNDMIVQGEIYRIEFEE